MAHRKWTMQQLEELVKAGVSFNEIRRTCGADHRTVKRYFPEYHPFDVGGWKDQGGAIRQINQDLAEFERTNKITTKAEKQDKQRALDKVRQAENADYIERRW